MYCDGTAMTDAHQDLGLDALSAEQRYELAMTLLDSVFAGPTPPEHLAEIRRRVAEMEAGHLPGEPWRNVFDRILGRQLRRRTGVAICSLVLGLAALAFPATAAACSSWPAHVQFRLPSGQPVFFNGARVYAGGCQPLPDGKYHVLAYHNGALVGGKQIRVRSGRKFQPQK
jgi:hypothetical protein